MKGLKVFSWYGAIFPFLFLITFTGEKAFLNPSGNRHTSPQVNLTALSSAIKAHIVELEGSPNSFRTVFHFPGATKVRVIVKIKIYMTSPNLRISKKLK